MTTMHADDVHPGDVIEYHGQRHHIARIERSDGWAWPVAFDDAGWAIALGHSPVILHRHTDGPLPSC